MSDYEIGNDDTDDEDSFMTAEADADAARRISRESGSEDDDSFMTPEDVSPSAEPSSDTPSTAADGGNAPVSSTPRPPALSSFMEASSHSQISEEPSFLSPNSRDGKSGPSITEEEAVRIDPRLTRYLSERMLRIDRSLDEFRTTDHSSTQKKYSLWSHASGGSFGRTDLQRELAEVEFQRALSRVSGASALSELSETEATEHTYLQSEQTAASPILEEHGIEQTERGLKDEEDDISQARSSLSEGGGSESQKALSSSMNLDELVSELSPSPFLESGNERRQSDTSLHLSGLESSTSTLLIPSSGTGSSKKRININETSIQRISPQLEGIILKSKVTLSELEHLGELYSHDEEHGLHEDVEQDYSTASFDLSTSTLQEELASANIDTATAEINRRSLSEEGMTAQSQRSSAQIQDDKEASVPLHQESHPFMERQVDDKGDDEPTKKKRGFWSMGRYAVSAIILIKVTAIVAVVLLTTKKASGRSLPLRSIYGRNGDAIGLSEDQMMKHFALLVGDEVFKPGYPHSGAAKWMLRDDDGRDKSKDALTQRFLLVFFYLVTSENGKSPWKSCNPSKASDSSNCAFKSPVYDGKGHITSYSNVDSVRWLSPSEHECNWAGVECISSKVHCIQLGGQMKSPVFVHEMLQLRELESIGT